MARQTDVVIAGGGPVGMTLGIELQRRGVTTVLLEKAAEPSYFVKALGITPRTLRMWDQLGFLPEALDAGLFLQGTATLTNGEPGERQTMPPGTFPYGFQTLAQFEAERILRAELVRRGGVIQWNHALTGFSDDGERVTVSVAGPDGAAETISARYLVGCDGAHSAVRHGLQLDYEGDALPMTFMLGDVLVDWQLPRGWAYRLFYVESGQMLNQLIAIPIPGDPRRYRLSMAAPPDMWNEGADLSAPPTLDLLSESARRMLPPGATLSQLRWSSFYRISHRIAPRYSAGRVFIAGDAAHIHPPIGGQGMNTGMQDAHNLGWKLALACADRAAPDLLDSYSEERHPVGLDVVQRTSRRMAASVGQQDRGEDVEQLRVDSQLAVSYRDTPWVAQDVGADPAGPRAGDLVPDAGGLRAAWLDAPLRLVELMRHPGLTLVLYADAATTESQHRALVACADAVPRDLVDVRGIAAPDAAPPALERILWLTDAEGRFRSALAATTASLWLLRPDGYVAYRATPADPSRLTTFLRRIIV